MAPVYKYTDVEKVLKRLGFTFDRQTGSHRVWEKDGVK
ncbi:MAG: type II toxin-antitoxin system HicA family toxin [Candidatus Gracilibacteria bacterium]